MSGLSSVVRIAFIAGLAWPNLSVARAERAAPWIILIQEEGTSHRTALTDWHENLQLMLSLGKPATTLPRVASAAKGLRVAMFWGPQWKDWGEKGIDPDTLSFDSATQYATLYRATEGDPAYWRYDGPVTLRPDLREIDSSGVGILESHGIAVRARRL